MPTTVTSVIGTGGDYTTIQTWEDACPADLVAADQVWLGECKNQTFTEAVTIGGQTTDATRYLELKCQSGASFKDHADVRTNALRYNTANGMALTGNVPLTIATNYTRVNGLQAANNSGYGRTVDISAGVTNCLVTQSILKDGTGAFFTTLSRSATNVFANCLIECPSASNHGANSQGQWRNCTIICSTGSSTGTGFDSGYSNGMALNCAVFAFGTAYNGTAAGGSGYNASDSASTFGSNNQSSLTTADQFESATNDFRAKSTGALPNNGTPDSTYASVDISGTTRSASTPTIGCWEVTATGTMLEPSIGVLTLAGVAAALRYQINMPDEP